MAAKATRVGDVSWLVRLDLSEVPKQFRQFEQKAKQHARRSKNIIERVFRANFLEDLYSRAWKALYQLSVKTTQLSTEFQSMGIRMEAATGRNVQANFARLINLSNEFGVSLRETTEGFTRFASSIKGTALESQADQLYRAFAKVSGAFGLNRSQQAGALLGIEQIINTGVVRMQELYQITSRIPGGMKKASEALGITPQRLRTIAADPSQQISAGEFIPSFMRLLDAQAEAIVNTERSIATWMRFDNTIYQLQLKIGDINRALLDKTLPALTKLLDGVLNVFEHFEREQVREKAVNRDIGTLFSRDPSISFSQRNEAARSLGEYIRDSLTPMSRERRINYNFDKPEMMELFRTDPRQARSEIRALRRIQEQLRLEQKEWGDTPALRNQIAMIQSMINFLGKMIKAVEGEPGAIEDVETITVPKLRDVIRFHRSLIDTQEMMADHAKREARFAQDLERRTEDSQRQYTRAIRDWTESYEDFLRNTANETESLARQVQLTQRRTSSQQSINRINANLGVNPGSFGEAFASLFENLVTAELEFQGQIVSLEEQRRQEEERTLDISRQIRTFQEQREDLERNRTRELESLARSQEDFTERQEKSWKRIQRRVEDMRKTADEMGISFTSIAETIKKAAILMDSIALTGEMSGKGIPLGYVGNTGRSTGPHVDLRVKVNGKYINPSDYVKYFSVGGNPLASYTLTSGYGIRIMDGKKEFHPALDFAGGDIEGKAIEYLGPGKLRSIRAGQGNAGTMAVIEQGKAIIEILHLMEKSTKYHPGRGGPSVAVAETDLARTKYKGDVAAMLRDATRQAQAFERALTQMRKTFGDMVSETYEFARPYMGFMAELAISQHEIRREEERRLESFQEFRDGIKAMISGGDVEKLKKEMIDAREEGLLNDEGIAALDRFLEGSASAADLLSEVDKRMEGLAKTVQAVTQRRLSATLLENAQIVAEEVGDERRIEKIIRRPFRNAVSGLIMDVSTGFANIESIIYNTLTRLAQAFADFAANALMRSLFAPPAPPSPASLVSGGNIIGSILGFGGGGISWGASAPGGLSIPGATFMGGTSLFGGLFNNGGMVSGPGAYLPGEGHNGVIIGASVGEQVLSQRNGDAQTFRSLKRSGQWDRIKTGGGRGGDVNYFNITTPSLMGLRKNQSRIAQEQNLAKRRAERYSG